MSSQTILTRRATLIGILGSITTANTAIAGCDACKLLEGYVEPVINPTPPKAVAKKQAPAARSQPSHTHQQAKPAQPAVRDSQRIARGGRRLYMTDTHSSRRIDVVYWADGVYFADALREINSFMRDRKNGQIKKYDVRALNILSLAHQRLDTSEPFQLISGYRSPQTNAKLRASTKGVAKNSLHMRGQATDVRLSGRSISQIARAAASCKGGGVGKYSGSNFVHMDCGPVRTWGA